MSLLDRLLDPEARRELVDSFPHEPLVRLGAPERIAGLFPQEMLDLHALAAAFHDPVTAWFHDDAAYGDGDPGPTSATRSIARYEAGALLQFNYVERWLPGLAPLLRSLEDDLAIPSGTAHCQLFASKTGSGAKAHWDNDPVLTVQLRGSKTWRFAPQDLVRHPVHNHVCGTGRGPLGEYYQGPLPEDMPADAREVVLTPGSVLFVPRGYLHHTATTEASISLAFDFTMPTWTDVVCHRLRRTLERHEAWRDYAMGIVGDDLAGPRRRLEGMLDELQRAVDALRADPDVALREADPALLHSGVRSFRRTGAATSFTMDRHVCHIELEPPQRARVELEVSPELVELCRWLLTGTGIVTQRELLRHGAALDRTDIASTVGALIELGALEPVVTPPSEAALRARGNGPAHSLPSR